MPTPSNAAPHTPSPGTCSTAARIRATRSTCPTPYCGNPILVRCAETVVHVVRLGILQLPGRLSPKPAYAAQAALLEALSERDPKAARRAVYRIAEIPMTRETRPHLEPSQSAAD